MKIFISGSMSINELHAKVKEYIDENIILKNESILVGDANGIDALVQEYCAHKSYDRVSVYYVGKEPRNCKSNNFASNHIEAKCKDIDKPSRKEQMKKDEEMTNDSDCSFVIWDGESKGSLNNIERAMKNNKKVILFFKNEIIEESEKIEQIIKQNKNYSAKDIVEELKSMGIDKFKNEKDLYKHFTDKGFLKQEDKIYKIVDNSKKYFKARMFKGIKNGVYFTNSCLEFLNEEFKSTLL